MIATATVETRNPVEAGWSGKTGMGGNRDRVVLLSSIAGSEAFTRDGGIEQSSSSFSAI